MGDMCWDRKKTVNPSSRLKKILLRYNWIIVHCHYTYLICLIWHVWNTLRISLWNYHHSQDNEHVHWPQNFILPVYSLLTFLWLPSSPSLGSHKSDLLSFTIDEFIFSQILYTVNSTYSFCLTSFLKHNYFKTHAYCWKYWCAFYCWVAFHFMDISQFVYPFFCFMDIGIVDISSVDYYRVVMNIHLQVFI